MATPYQAPFPRPVERLPDYVAVFNDREAPQEHTFTAASDAHAREQMRKEYRERHWTLYRIGKDGQRDEVCFHFEEK
jgi:hypothetical protein